MKKYLSIDNGLLMLCMSLFLFMMFICTQLLVSGYIENRTPEEIYVVNEKQITEHQLNQLSHILKECDANAYMTGIYMKDGDLFERKEMKLWLNHEKNYDLKSNFMFEENTIKISHCYLKKTFFAVNYRNGRKAAPSDSFRTETWERPAMDFPEKCSNRSSFNRMNSSGVFLNNGIRSR